MTRKHPPQDPSRSRAKPSGRTATDSTPPTPGRETEAPPDPIEPTHGVPAPGVEPSRRFEAQQNRPAQQEGLPGEQSKMKPTPDCGERSYRGSGKLEGKKAIITGGDSGIGRAIAIAFAREGADVAIVYLSEHNDARETGRHVQESGRQCLFFDGDVGDEDYCRETVEMAARQLGGLNIIVNNAAEQWEQERPEDITAEQLERTFRTNIFAYFHMVRAALPHLSRGDSIINTTSVTAYRGSPHLIDYSATKGAIVAYTRSLALNLAERGIRVNGVAPGPIWTPLIPASFKDPEHVKSFGENVAMKRAGQPVEVATSYVFLASNDASYMTGQILHPNGGDIVNA
jgi:NAD(P)-dependent dehydrogenase (short-subunit alcohol dehydrogenase family)